MRLYRFSIRAAAAVCLCAIAGCGPIMPQGLSTPAAYQSVGKDGEKVRLAVHEAGAGKPVVLIHGLGASSYTWNKIAPDLARGHRVIAIDLKGFGQSDKPLDEHYSIFDQARLVEDYLAEKNLKGVTLVGHSFGGGVALAVAVSQMEQRNHRIERLVLIDSIAYRQPIPFFFQLLRMPLIGHVGLAVIPPEVQAERALASAYYNERKVAEDAVQHYADPLRTEGGRHALLRTIDSLEPETADTISVHYRDLKLPTLILWCEHDRIVPLKYGKKLAADLPNARMELIHSCGHIPHEEQPTETMLAIRSFLQ